MALWLWSTSFQPQADMKIERMVANCVYGEGKPGNCSRFRALRLLCPPPCAASLTDEGCRAPRPDIMFSFDQATGVMYTCDALGHHVVWYH